MGREGVRVDGGGSRVVAAQALAATALAKSVLALESLYFGAKALLATLL